MYHCSRRWPKPTAAAALGLHTVARHVVMVDHDDRGRVRSCPRTGRTPIRVAARGRLATRGAAQELSPDQRPNHPTPRHPTPLTLPCPQARPQPRLFAASSFESGACPPPPTHPCPTKHYAIIASKALASPGGGHTPSPCETKGHGQSTGHHRRSLSRSRSQSPLPLPPRSRTSRASPERPPCPLCHPPPPPA